MYALNNSYRILKNNKKNPVILKPWRYSNWWPLIKSLKESSLMWRLVHRFWRNMMELECWIPLIRFYSFVWFILFDRNWIPLNLSNQIQRVSHLPKFHFNSKAAFCEPNRQIQISLTDSIQILSTIQVVKPDNIPFQFFQSQIPLTNSIPSKNILQTKHHIWVCFTSYLLFYLFNCSKNTIIYIYNILWINWIIINI